MKKPLRFIVWATAMLFATILLKFDSKLFTQAMRVTDFWILNVAFAMAATVFSFLVIPLFVSDFHVKKFWTKFSYILLSGTALYIGNCLSVLHQLPSLGANLIDMLAFGSFSFLFIFLFVFITDRWNFSTVSYFKGSKERRAEIAKANAAFAELLRESEEHYSEYLIPGENVPSLSHDTVAVGAGA